MPKRELERCSSSTASEDEDDDVWGDEEFFSDESSFYGECNLANGSDWIKVLSATGDDDMKASYERRAASYDPTAFWEAHLRSVQYIAAQDRSQLALGKLASPPSGFKTEDVSQPMSELPSREKNTHPAQSDQDTDAMELDTPPNPSNPSPTKPYNPYEGYKMGKQLSESLSDFLTRLPPSTTTLESGPWIFIANPTSPHRPTDPNFAVFKQQGTLLLEQYQHRRLTLEEANPAKPPGSITRMLAPNKAKLETSLTTLAKSNNLTSGKWMLFPTPSSVDAIWSRVAKATLDGSLGIAAKVATDHHSSGSGNGNHSADDGDIDDGIDGGIGSANNPKPERVICIYTANAWCKPDVFRVLTALEKLGLVDGDKPIYYKCDAYTYLDIMSGNEWKLRPSLYGSRDLTREMLGTARTGMGGGVGASAGGAGVKGVKWR